VSREKLRVANTDLDNLVGNLRGEVGEVVTTWLLMRQFRVRGAQMTTDDLERDMANRELAFHHLLADKLRDELVGRLSELAERKIGQLTFYFAARKLESFDAETNAFEAYVLKQRIRDKRNQDVSHKQLPEKLMDRDHISIPYRVLVRAVAMALRLMKKIDRKVLGPSAPYLWGEARKKRYDYMSPPRAGYLLLPYFLLSGQDRLRVIQEEQREGAEVWSPMPTMINGRPETVMACKKWGVVAIGNGLMVLPQYPLQHLASIDTNPSEPAMVPQTESDTPSCSDGRTG
jgi:hypothetical protein